MKICNICGHYDFSHRTNGSCIVGHCDCKGELTMNNNEETNNHITVLIEMLRSNIELSGEQVDAINAAIKAMQITEKLADQNSDIYVSRVDEIYGNIYYSAHDSLNRAHELAAGLEKQ